jgi:hypothetical protein
VRTVLPGILIWLWCGVSAHADRIVLRNLDVISDTKVEQFDEDGVRLENGTVISWDRIERGRVSEAEQAAFDRMLGELGEHLYRIRQRLTTGDYPGLLPHAEAVYERYVGRRSETAYMVSLALMWSRLALGQREGALGPYLNSLETLRQATAAGRELAVPGPRRLQADLETGLCAELPPVWFDGEAARAALSGVGAAIAAMAAPRPPATRIYYATLALAAGDSGLAGQTLNGLDQLPALKSVVEGQLLLSQGDPDKAIAVLQQPPEPVPAALEPLALYWLGQSRLQEPAAEAHTAGLLDLLRIAALYGQDQPELAAAGLYAAMRALAESGDVRGSIAIRRELLDRYAQTWHAKRLKDEDQKAEKSR